VSSSSSIASFQSQTTPEMNCFALFSSIPALLLAAILFRSFIIVPMRGFPRKKRLIIFLVWVKKFSSQFDHWTKPDKNNTSFLCY